MAWRKPRNLREWLRVIFRHKRKFVFPMLGMMIVVVWASQFVPREYRAEATFERRNESMTALSGGRSDNLLDPIRASLIQDLTSKPTVEQLVDDLQLTRNLPHNPDGSLTTEGQLAKFDMVKRVAEKLRVYFAIRTDQVDRIVVTFTDVDRVLAPRIVNRVVTNYIDRTRNEVNARLVSAKAFFDREVNRYRAKVTDLEAKKLRFELDNRGLSDDDPMNLQSTLVEKRARLARVEEELQIEVARRDTLQKWVDSQPEFLESVTTITNPVLNDLMMRHSALSRELEEHLTRWGRTEDHPSVKKTRMLLEETDQKMKVVTREVPGSTSKTPNPQRLTAQQEVESVKGKIAGLERQREELRNEVQLLDVQSRNFFVVRNEYQRIIREHEENMEQLGFWETNLRHTTLTLQQEVAQHGMRMSIISRAPDLARPSSPTLVTILGAALVLGVGAGAAMIILTELLDHTFRSVEQAVDDLKLPLLGTVNEIVSPAQAVRRRIYALAVLPAVGSLMALVLLVSIYFTHMSLSDPQRFDNLKAQVKSVLPGV